MRYNGKMAVIGFIIIMCCFMIIAYSFATDCTVTEISGTVTDCDSEEPIPDVAVTYLTDTVYTGSDNETRGEYTIDNATEGYYAIVFDKYNYENKTILKTWRCDNSYTKDICLDCDDTTEPILDWITFVDGNDNNSTITLTDNQTFTNDNESLNWRARDPNAPGDDWGDLYGVVENYFTYKAVDDTVWEDETPLVWLGGSAGFIGVFKWVRPTVLITDDGHYDVRLISEDECGNRGIEEYEIIINDAPDITNVEYKDEYDNKTELTDNQTFTKDNESIIWASEDPGYPGDDLGWASRLGIEHTYVSHRETGQTEWSVDTETTYNGGIGFWGQWSWVYPTGYFSSDDTYDIRLSAVDGDGNRTDVVYTIIVDTE